MNTLLAFLVTSMVWTAEPGEVLDSIQIHGAIQVCNEYNLTKQIQLTNSKGDVVEFICRMEEN